MVDLTGCPQRSLPAIDGGENTFGIGGPDKLRWTERKLTPETLAIIRPVQCVASPGGSDKVSPVFSRARMSVG
jgi:hypothetical protein